MIIIIKILARRRSYFILLFRLDTHRLMFSNLSWKVEKHVIISTKYVIWAIATLKTEGFIQLTINFYLQSSDEVVNSINGFDMGWAKIFLFILLYGVRARFNILFPIGFK